MRRRHRQDGIFSSVSTESRVPKSHPLRIIPSLIDEGLATLSVDLDAAYAEFGRPSIAPEKLIRTSLLQVFYSIRREQIDYNLLFRWFVGLSVDEAVWVPTVFTKNRQRLLEGEAARAFFNAVVDQARQQGLLSDDHFTGLWSRIEAWSWHKSFKPKDDGPQTPPLVERYLFSGFPGGHIGLFAPRFPSPRASRPC